jgi:5-methylcytosine-specific restriction endonuclease McrA
MAISKKIRFEVFKRDGFQCAYCGKTPPQVTLEVDHVDPKSKGGKDDINNLITACFDCNRGKRNIPLSKVPAKLTENLEVLQEQEDQIKAYRQFIKKIERRVKKDIDEINDIYTKAYPGWQFSD